MLSLLARINLLLILILLAKFPDSFVLAQAPEGDPPFPIQVELLGGYQTQWDRVELRWWQNSQLSNAEADYVEKGMSIFFDENSNLNQKKNALQTLAQTHPASSINAKLELQNRMSYILARDYNSILAGREKNKNPALDEILAHALDEEFGNGGICGGIHSILANFATAQGFIHAGAHSLAWNQSGKFKKDEGHILAHFQDPITKKYYFQNYQMLVDAQTKDFREMLERSLAFHSVLSQNIFVESVPGRVHQFQDNRSRWMMEQIEHFANSDKIGLHGEIRLSNLQQSFGAGYGLKLGEVGVGQFFVSRHQFQGANGEHALTQVGVAINFEHTIKFKDSVVDEIYLSVGNFLALANYANPNLAAGLYGNNNDWNRTLLEWGLDATGKIKVGPFSVGAKIYSRVDMLDFFSTHSDQSLQYLEALAESETPIPMVNLEYIKRFQVVPKTLANDEETKVASVFDYVGLVFDTRKIAPNSPVYLINRSGVYLLDGLEDYAGNALCSSLELVWRAWDRLEFSAKARVTWLLENRFDDPLFGQEGDFSCELSLGFKCQITENLSLNFSGGYRGENQPLYFLTPMNVRPDLNTGDDSLFVQGGLEWQWGARSNPVREELFRQERERSQQRYQVSATPREQITLHWKNELSNSSAITLGKIDVKRIQQGERFVYLVSWWVFERNAWRMTHQNAWSDKAVLQSTLLHYLQQKKIFIHSDYAPTSEQILAEFLKGLI